jgi:hypothetical protein
VKRLINLIEKWAALFAVILSALTLTADYLTGPYISFPVLFIFPVALMAWFRSCRWAIFLSLVLCAARQEMSVHWQAETKFSLSIIFINTEIRMVVLFLVALLISRVARQQRGLLTKVRVLEGILPVCSFCKKIRNDENVWESIETYIGRRSEAQFSHSICPECGKIHYGDFLEVPI